MTELREGMEEAVFYGKWVDANAGNTRNKAKGAAAGQGGVPGRPAAANAGGAPAQQHGATPKSSLFGPKS